MEKISFLTIVTLIFTILISILIGSSAIGVSLITYLFTTIIVCYFLGNKKRKEVSDLLTIFLVSFIFYVLYALIAYASYLDSNSFFLFPDQYGLFEDSETLGTSKNVFEIFKLCFIDRSHIEMEGFYFLIGLISYVANSFFDGNSILLQSLHVSFLAIFINLLMYKYLKQNGLNNNLKKYTIIYALFSPVFFYSPWILRDIHIALLFMLGLILVSSKFSIKRLLYLLVITYISFEFRVENGLFMLVFVLYFIIFKAKQHSYYKLLRFTFILMLIIVLPSIVKFLVQELSNTITTLELYKIYTEESLADQGLGRYLYELPFGIKHIAIALYSQLTQFPPWAILVQAVSPYQVMVGIVAFIKSIFWSLLFITSLVSLFFKKARKTLSNENVILLLFFVLYLLLNTSNMNDRRLLAMYPVLFLYISNLNQKLSKNQQNRYLKISIIVYMLLIIVYIFIKLIII